VNDYLERRRAEYEKAREGFAPAATSLPSELAGENAVKLLAIAHELERSYLAELRLARMVSDVDPGDPAAVRAVASELEWYHEQAVYNNERTHCSNISRNAAGLRAPIGGESPVTRQRREEFDKLVASLADADDSILDSIEQISAEARDAAVAMREAERSGPERVREIQAAYATATRERNAVSKERFRQLNRLSGRLIDVAGDLQPYESGRH
jgi:hypothetical protein